MKVARAISGLVPGVGPLASAGIGAAAGLGLLGKPLETEPEIPTAMDDWDREFEARTGALPSFSRLAVKPDALKGLRIVVNRISGGYEPDALSFAGKRR